MDMPVSHGERKRYMSKTLVDIPIRETKKALTSEVRSLECRGLLATALMAILERGAPLPSDDTRSAKLLGVSTLAYRRHLLTCLADGTLVRTAEGVDAPLAGLCRGAQNLRRVTLSSGLRDEVLRKTSGRCVYCGERLMTASGHPNSFEPDHVLPVALGGSDDVANLVPSCRSCNRKKRSRTALNFLGAR